MKRELSGGTNEEISGGTNGFTADRVYGGNGKTWVVREPQNMEFSNKDLILALAMIVCGFLYWNLIKPESLGAGVSIFALTLCMIVYGYFKMNDFVQSKRAMICIGLITISAANFILFDNIFIKVLNFLFLSLLFIYWVCCLTDRKIDKELSIYIIGDFINQLFVVPFSNLNCCFAAIRRSLFRNEHGKNILGGILGLLIFLPVLVVVTSLLVKADAAFESLIDNLQFNISASIMEYMVQFIFGLPVACYLFGLIYGNRYGRHTSHITIESMQKNAVAFRFAPGIAIYSALTALNLIYIVFFISQAVYLFSAFGNSLPETMTYAEYARRGFFELCAVSGINLLVIAAAHLITSRKNSNEEEIPKVLKAETLLTCLFTILLIITAISKMAMYINYYGLTQLRVYTTWFMLFLMIIFVVLAARQFRQFNGCRILIICFVISFTILCYGNIDGSIAKYNIERYRAGTLETVDTAALRELSDGAVPYIYELYKETEDGALKASLKWAMSSDEDSYRMEDGKNTSFRDFNLQKYKADQIRATF